MDRTPLVKTLAVSICAVVTGIAFSTAVAAPGADGPGKGQDRGKHRGQDPEVRAEKMFDRLDADGSGAVTVDEFLARPEDRAERQFARLDTDEDSSLSLEEFLERPDRDRSGRERPGRGRPGQDRPGQGRPDLTDIDKEAVKACVEEALDIDLPERPEPEEVFAMMDANSDGAVSQDEFMSAAETRSMNRFGRMDADGDGGITLEELQAALEARASHREARKQCVEEQLAADELTGS